MPFNTLRPHRISVRVLSYNHRAIEAYEKRGIVHAGGERDAAFVNGSWHVMTQRPDRINSSFFP
jgi:RimJ/RimL family protein N-acetyltransferase